MIDGASARLDDQLERLAALHRKGDLDDAEYRAAKAQILAPSLSSAEVAQPTVRTLGPLKWTTWALIAVVLGFTLACLSSAMTDLQAPAGPILCRDGRFVAGNVSEQYGGTTSYNIDSSCITDAAVRDLSQVAIIGVLWFEYTIAVLVIIAALVWTVRGLRGPPRPEGHDGVTVVGIGIGTRHDGEVESRS